MNQLQEKVKKSIERLKAFEPPEGYYLAFSGGKDSVVCKALLDMSGCKYDATYRVTSVDPPELVRFIKEKHPDVNRNVPHYSDDYKNPKLAGKPITMWNLIPEKLMPPTRLVRYCCTSLKESGGDGRMTVTGVRWEESYKRKQNQGIVTIIDRKAAKNEELANNSDFLRTNLGGVVLTNDNTESRKVVEHCYKQHKTTVNPIIEWSEQDVWDFIKANGIPYCSLYDEGFKRLGCIGCPMASQKGREHEFRRWSKYKHHYLLAFERMIAERNKRGRKNKEWQRWATPKDVFNWWMEYDILPGQMNWFEDFEDLEDGDS